MLENSKPSMHIEDAEILANTLAIACWPSLKIFSIINLALINLHPEILGVGTSWDQPMPGPFP